MNETDKRLNCANKRERKQKDLILFNLVKTSWDK